MEKIKYFKRIKLNHSENRESLCTTIGSTERVCQADKGSKKRNNVFATTSCKPYPGPLCTNAEKNLTHGVLKCQNEMCGCVSVKGLRERRPFHGIVMYEKTANCLTVFFCEEIRQRHALLRLNVTCMRMFARVAREGGLPASFKARAKN